MRERTPVRVLLIEDELDDAEVFRRYAGESELYSIGVDHVTGADKALRRLAENEYEVLFLDQQLGARITGLDILKRITAAQPELPAIALTGTGDQKLAVEMMKAGATDYLVKDTFDSGILELSVRRALEWRRGVIERRRTDQKLREGEERFRTLFEGIPDAVLVHDDRGEVIHANEVAAERLGWPVEELVGMNLRDLVTPGNAARIPNHIEETHAGGSTAFETTYISRNGKHIEAETHESLIEFDGQPAILSVSRDITKRKILEQQLRQSQKMEAIGQLAGGVAHDFNNLLQVVNGYAGLVLHALDADSPLRDYVKEIALAGARAEHLTRQLLAFGGRQTLETKSVNLNELVRHFSGMLARLIREDIVLSTHMDEDVGNVRADPGQIEQVVANLVLNARDAMPHGGKLVIETRRAVLDQHYCDIHPPLKPGHYVMLAITDTGCGIDEEALGHIFEPFFSTKERGEGVGLGLSMVYGIVGQHGGGIDVSSEPGRGTTFAIYLPRVDAEAERPAASSEIEPVPRGSETILIVEDESAVLGAVMDMLQAQGYQVLGAMSAEEAENALEEHGDRIALLLTDVILRGCNGRQLSEQLTHRLPALKILYMSGYISDLLAQYGVLEPDIDLIRKPFTAQAVGRKVREILDR